MLYLLCVSCCIAPACLCVLPVVVIVHCGCLQMIVFVLFDLLCLWKRFVSWFCCVCFVCLDVCLFVVSVFGDVVCVSLRVLVFMFDVV